MRGNEIMVSANPQGKFVEGIISGTPYPGTIVQPDTSVALVGGRQTWVVYDADADGGRPKGPFIVLREDHLQGKIHSDAYASGDRGFGYIPLAGDELNLYWKDEDTGTTTNDIAAGQVGIVDDGTGLIIATTGSPETEVCMANEAANNLDGDTWVWSVWTGH